MIGKQVTLREGYYWYKREQEGIGDDGKVTRGEYHKIANLFFQFFMSKVFEGHKVQMGSALGDVYIRGRKPTYRVLEGKVLGVPVDWGETRKYWRVLAKDRGMSFEDFIKNVPRSERTPVYHANEETDGLRYAISWSRLDVKLLTKSMYSLIFTRYNKRMCAKLVKDGKEFEIVTAHLPILPELGLKAIRKRHYEGYKKEAAQNRVQ